MVNYWLIAHNLTAYKEHPDRIGRSKDKVRSDRNFRAIRKGDKVIYYAIGDRVVTGLFKVYSNMLDFGAEKDTIEWNETKGFQIKPIYVPSTPLEFQARDWGLLGRLRTANRLTPDQYRQIKSFILGMSDPSNHEGVVALFAKIHRELGFPRIKEIRQAFPDGVVIDEAGQERRIEFEYRSNDFEGHSPTECDLIVCWEDDWGPLAEISVIELKNIIYGSS